jgi:DNA-binding Lrp family transcriptional regulator
MKNSRRSDRQLAKAIGISQPTASRLIRKLEKEGVIKEYTMIPDFTRLGYTLMAATLLQVQEPLIQERFQEIRKVSTKIDKIASYAGLLAVNSIGGNKNRLFITFYESYSDYVEGMKLARQIPFVNVESVESFLVDLDDETNFRVLSISAIADNVLKLLERKKKNERE